MEKLPLLKGFEENLSSIDVMLLKGIAMQQQTPFSIKFRFPLQEQKDRHEFFLPYEVYINHTFSDALKGSEVIKDDQTFYDKKRFSDILSQRLEGDYAALSQGIGSPRVAAHTIIALEMVLDALENGLPMKTVALGMKKPELTAMTDRAIEKAQEKIGDNFMKAANIRKSGFVQRLDAEPTTLGQISP